MEFDRGSNRQTEIMKALIKDGDFESYKLATLNKPVPNEGELLIKILKVSICGSDIALYKWNDVGKSIASLPFIPGHECVGMIEAIGENCPPEYREGQRVCCENHFFCGECYQCSHDQQNVCQNMGQYGHGRGTMHGGCSVYSIIPARYCYILKTDIDDNKACILEPFGVAHNACEELKPQNDTVLVQGCGAIGLMSIGIIKWMGASKIIATDIFDQKLEKAKIMGADVVVNGRNENLKDVVFKETDGNGAGRILEASGAQPLVNESFQLLRKGGRCVFVGIPKEPLHVENVGRDIIFKSLTLKTVHGRKIFRSWEESEKLIHENKVDVSCIITHDYPMSKFEEAFRILFDGEGCKIILDPSK
ncbi:L-threonine 3-dehydrogenase-like [Rhopilema esculentum]|uniref:L-threonine 3-dehydrogenase-like n=1 Tax=Rhopilema esculentum TaxID=499914 RepID=UPI0031CE51C6